MKGIDKCPHCGSAGANGGLVLAVTRKETLFYEITSEGVVNKEKIWEGTFGIEEHVIHCRYCNSTFNFDADESEGQWTITELIRR